MSTSENPEVGGRPVDPTAGPSGPTRREILLRNRAQKRRNRPFIIAGIVIFLAVMAVPAYAYYQTYVLPPREVAVQVDNVIYTRGDVVKFIRFHQRLALEQGTTFNITDNLLSALETISENEIAYQKAPALGVSVSTDEVDAAIRELLGFGRVTAEQARDPSTAGQIREAQRQLLNRTQLTESELRDIVRKGLFRDKTRQVLSQNVPRVQRQVHVFAVDLNDANPATVERVRRALAAGSTIQAVALEHSVDPAVQRTRGEVGWYPQGIVRELDNLFFGLNQSGERILPVGALSEPRWNGQRGVYTMYYISEISDAREVSDENYDVLTLNAFKQWVEGQRRELVRYRLVLNDRIFSWITRQVRLSSIAPTPTPAPPSPFGVIR